MRVRLILLWLLLDSRLSGCWPAGRVRHVHVEQVAQHRVRRHAAAEQLFPHTGLRACDAALELLRESSLAALCSSSTSLRMQQTAALRSSSKSRAALAGCVNAEVADRCCWTSVRVKEIESDQSALDSVTSRSELVSQIAHHFRRSLLETCARLLRCCSAGRRFVGLRERLHNSAQTRVSAEQRVEEPRVTRWLSGCAARPAAARTRPARRASASRRLSRALRLASCRRRRDIRTARVECRTRALLKHKKHCEVRTPAEDNTSRHSKRQSHRPVSSSCSAACAAHCSYCEATCCSSAARAASMRSSRSTSSPPLSRRFTVEKTPPASRKRIVRASRTAQASAFLA